MDFQHIYPFVHPADKWYGRTSTAVPHHGATDNFTMGDFLDLSRAGVTSLGVNYSYEFAALHNEVISALLPDGPFPQPAPDPLHLASSGYREPVTMLYPPKGTMPFTSPPELSPLPPHSNYSTTSNYSTEAEEQAAFWSTVANLFGEDIAYPSSAGDEKESAVNSAGPGPSSSRYIDSLEASPLPANSIFANDNNVLPFQMGSAVASTIVQATQRTIGDNYIFHSAGIPGRSELPTMTTNAPTYSHPFGFSPAQSTQVMYSTLLEKTESLEEARNSHNNVNRIIHKEPHIAPEPANGTHPVSGTATFDAASETTGVTLPQPKPYKARRKNYKYECGICKEPYSVEKERDKHVYSAHKRCVGWQCPGYLKDVCSQESFLSSWELHRHLLGKTRKRCRVLAERKGWDARNSATCKVLRRTVPATM